MKYTFRYNCQIDHDRLNEIYLDTFGYTSDGTFVEVGACDGIEYSNTECLARLGWTGIFVEPVPELAERCRKNYEYNCKVEVDECAITNYCGTVRMKKWGSLSSSIHDSVKGVPFEVTCKTLDALLTDHGINSGFELLVIDVEFVAELVLEGFTLDFWKPKLVIIELHETCPTYEYALSEPARQKAYSMFPQCGYEVVYKDIINTIFRLKR